MESVIDYSCEITGYYNMEMARVDGPTIYDKDWYVVEVFIKFLKIFYDSTVLLSGVFYPTSHLALHQVLEMSEMLHSYKDDVVLKTAWNKYSVNLINLKGGWIDFNP